MTSQNAHLIRLVSIVAVGAFAQIALADSGKSPACPKDYWELSAAATNVTTREVLVVKAGQKKPADGTWIDGSLCFSSTTGDVVLVDAGKAAATTAAVK